MPATTKQRKKLVRLISALADMADSIHAANLLMGGAPEELYGHFSYRWLCHMVVPLPRITEWAEFNAIIPAIQILVILSASPTFAAHRPSQ